MFKESISRKMTRLALAVLLSASAISCEAIRDNNDDCGVYLEFVYDYNMEFADSFNPQVATVDIFLFDAQGLYVLTKHASREELIGGNRMYLGGDLPVGKYKVLTVGGLSTRFRVSDGPIASLVPGRTSIDNVRICLERESSTVSHEFPAVWVGKAMEIDYRADLSVYTVDLIKYTNLFNFILSSYDGSRGSRAETPGYTFAVETPKGTAYGTDHSPLEEETVTYTPYYLAPGEGAKEIAVGHLNTTRLLYREDYTYRLIVKNAKSGNQVWDYDLMTILRHIKPGQRPDGTSLPMQEFLDRQSRWNVVIFYKEEPKGDGSEGFTAVAVEVNNWILWLNEIGV